MITLTWCNNRPGKSSSSGDESNIENVGINLEKSQINKVL